MNLKRAKIEKFIQKILSTKALALSKFYLLKNNKKRMQGGPIIKVLYIPVAYVL